MQPSWSRRRARRTRVRSRESPADTCRSKPGRRRPGVLRAAASGGHLSWVTNRSVHDDAANGFARMHQIESLVDVRERHRVRDQVVDVDLAVHVPVDDLRHVGATACAAECGALTTAPRHEVERTRLDLLSRARDADDYRDPPAAMT